jgi:hypothetical protein
MPAQCPTPQQGGVRSILMSVSLGNQRGVLELVEFDDHTFGVCRDGTEIHAQRYAQRDVERSVAAFLKTRRLLESGLDAAEVRSQFAS